jgi:hypothetical protein
MSLLVNFIIIANPCEICAAIYHYCASFKSLNEPLGLTKILHSHLLQNPLTFMRLNQRYQLADATSGVPRKGARGGKEKRRRSPSIGEVDDESDGDDDYDDHVDGEESIQRGDDQLSATLTHGDGDDDDEEEDDEDEEDSGCEDSRTQYPKGSGSSGGAFKTPVRYSSQGANAGANGGRASSSSTSSKLFGTSTKKMKVAPALNKKQRIKLFLSKHPEQGKSIRAAAAIAFRSEGAMMFPGAGGGDYTGQQLTCWKGQVQKTHAFRDIIPNAEAERVAWWGLRLEFILE